MSRRGSNPTVVFTTLRADIEPTAADVERLLPILQDIKAREAADRFPMDIVLQVKRGNIEAVKGMIAALLEGGFISNYNAQGLRGQVKRFENVVFR